MEDLLFKWAELTPVSVALISIVLNILIAITGVLPSTFITIGTVSTFNFTQAMIILIIGEAAGAIISFLLYRKGVYKFTAQRKKNKNKNYALLQRLQNAKGTTAFLAVILLRLIPFIPSGAVTIAAAFSQMRLLSFSTASTIGKIPALFIEAYSVSHVLSIQTEWQIGILLAALIVFLLYFLWKKKNSKHNVKNH